MPKIHPTAIVDASARLGDGAIVGPCCIIEGDVEIGAGTELRSHVIVYNHTTLGEGNVVDPFCVLGGLPQDLKFDPATETSLRIGDRNVFREGVTISRGSLPGGQTVVGSDTYWMTHSHAGHDATVNDRAVLTNNTGLGGHATLGRRAILSGGSFIHQFTWTGELVMTQGQAGISAHVPPYTLVAKINYLVGLNKVGLRRAEDLTDEDRRQIKEAFHLTYQAKLSPTEALAKMDEWADMTPAAEKFREFIRKVVHAEGRHKRPLCRFRPRRRRDG